MTNDRVARITHGYEAWNRGEPLPTSKVSPDFEFHPPPDLSGEGVQRGHDAGEGFKQGLEDAFESVQVTMLEVSERDDYVIAHVRVDGTGRHTGIKTSREEFHVYSYDERDTLRSMKCFVDEAEAIAAVEGRA